MVVADRYASNGRAKARILGIFKSRKRELSANLTGFPLPAEFAIRWEPEGTSADTVS